MIMSRVSVGQLLLCLLAFVSSLQCLNAAAIRALPRRRLLDKETFKSSLGRSQTPPSGGLGAPVRPDVFLPGQFVGVRVKSYEKGSKIDTIHPGVVVSEAIGASPGEYKVCMISSKLPGNPPQKSASEYQPGMKGNISLSPIIVAWGKMKLWKQQGGGPNQAASALKKEALEKLLKDIGAS